MIACHGDEDLSAAAAETACMDEHLKELLMDFAEWRKQRDRVLHSIIRGMQAWPGPCGTMEAGYPARCQDSPRTKEAS